MTKEEAKKLVDIYSKRMMLNEDEYKELFDALKYLADKEDDLDSISMLGRLYYQRGKISDTDKAYHYLNMARERKDVAAIVALADLKRSEALVSDDYSEYKKLLLEGLELVRKNKDKPGCLYPEVVSRLTEIMNMEDSHKDYLTDIVNARVVLEKRIGEDGPAPSDFYLLNVIVSSFYRVVPFDDFNFGIFDMIFIIEHTPIRISYHSKYYDIEPVEIEREDSFENYIRVNDDNFLNAIDLYLNAMLDGKHIYEVALENDYEIEAMYEGF